jgi:radical SAM superfamily enzyme YgiQ (UPF0313 family)
MRILLMTPLYVRDKIFRKSFKHLGALLPPLGLAYVAAVLEKDGNQVKIIDGAALSTKQDYNFNNLETEVKTFNPDIVGVTATSPQISFTVKLLDFIKKISPNSTTFLGGPHITAMPKITNDIKSLDYGIYGEGEQTFLEVTRKIKKNQKLEGTKGVIFKGNPYVKFIIRPYIEDLDTLPFPARHLLPMKLYKPSPANYRRLPATTMMTSRGCPFQCIFCHKPIFGQNFRPHSSKRVVDEMEHLTKKYGIKDIQIFDDTFTMDNKRAEEICKGMIERKLDIGWNCMTRVNTVTPDLLKLMHKAGCYEIGCGIESGSERIIKMIKKGTNKDMIRKAVKWAKQAKVEIRAFYMIGFPTETKEDIEETIKFAKELDTHIAQFLIVTPYPDTELWDLAGKHGIIHNDWSNFTMYSPTHAPFVPNSLTKQELEKLYFRAYKEYHLRPLYILKQLLKIRSFTDIKRNISAARAIIGF